MIKHTIRNLAKEIIALPYRMRFASLGRSVRIIPPLLLRGTRWINIGDRVILEQYVGLSVIYGGEILLAMNANFDVFLVLKPMTV